jgi:hypothetical protein
VKTQLQ